MGPPRHSFKRTVKSGRFGGNEVRILPPIEDTQGRRCVCSADAAQSPEEHSIQVQKLAMCLNNLQGAIEHLEIMRSVMKDTCEATARAFPDDPHLQSKVQEIIKEA